MYRECGLKRIRWTEKTMSMMRGANTDSCESFLRDLPPHGVFDSECTFTDAERLYAASFFATEDPVPDSIVSPEFLREAVLTNFPAELFLLSPGEHELLLKLIFFGGKMALLNDDDIDSAAGLLSRLWISVAFSGDRLEITMPRQLMTTAVLVMTGDKYKACRELIGDVDSSIERTLYLYGFMQVNGPFNHLKRSLIPICGTPDDRILRRFFRISYDYTYSPDGTMLLIHPGLVRIDFEEAGFPSRNDAMVDIDEDSLRSVIEQLGPQEQPLYDQMTSALTGHVRPELTTDDAVRDLIILAKQNVSESDMNSVLSALVSGIADPDMKIALHNMHERIPRWVSLTASRLQ